MQKTIKSTIIKEAVMDNKEIVQEMMIPLMKKVLNSVIEDKTKGSKLEYLFDVCKVDEEKEKEEKKEEEQKQIENSVEQITNCECNDNENKNIATTLTVIIVSVVLLIFCYIFS